MGPVDGVLALSGAWSGLHQGAASARAAAREHRRGELREHEAVASLLVLAAGAAATLITGLFWPLLAAGAVCLVWVGMHETVAARS